MQQHSLFVTHEVASGPAAIEKFFAGLHANGLTDHKLEVIDAGGDEKVVCGSAKERQRQGQGWQASDLLWHRHPCVRASVGWFAEAEVTYLQLSWPYVSPDAARGDFAWI